MTPRPRSQSGVALVTAMLITVLATIAAVAMASRQNLDTRRTGNVVEFDQAYLFALGVESWAREILAQDLKDGVVDHTGEPWSSILPPIEVERALVAGRIEDMQGRFNLNNLIDAAGNPSENEIARFRRLLRALGLDDGLADAVVDWIDPNADPRFPEGAEDQAYLDMDPPYRAANSPMVHPSELLLVRGFTSEVFDTIAPHIWTLPVRTTINVNTASAAVLMSLADGLSVSEAERLIADRGDKGYQTAEEFLAHPVLKERLLTIPNIAVSSSWFMINGNVRYGRNQVNLHSLVMRTQNARISVIMRSQGSF